jgi:myo-inositol-1(or 4)-monophosphatase
VTAPVTAPVTGPVTVPAPHVLLDTAVRAATRAAQTVQAMASTRSTVRWEEKGFADFVTEVDRASEGEIRSIVFADLPDARVLGEELSPDLARGAPLTADHGIVFVVDPLDGTTNFLHGYPQYAVSIAVVVDGGLVAGVVYHAVTDDVFTATAGGGAYRNGQPIAVSSIGTPSRALIGTGFPFSHLERLAEYQSQFAAVSRRVSGIRRAGSAALDLCDVACGRFEGFWELTLAPWDVAAGIVLVREAGGIVTDLSGAPVPIGHTSIVAGSPVMHRWLLDTLSQARTTSGSP